MQACPSAMEDSQGSCHRRRCVPTLHLTVPSLPALIDAPTLSVHGRWSAFQPPSRPRSNPAEEDKQTIRRYSGKFVLECALTQFSRTDCQKIVATGDFFQLPPVTQGGKDVFFAFQSDAWKESIERTVILTQVFRQKDSGKSVTQRRGNEAVHSAPNTHTSCSNCRFCQPAQRAPPRRDLPSHAENLDRPIQTTLTR